MGKYPMNETQNENTTSPPCIHFNIILGMKPTIELKKIGLGNNGKCYAVNRDRLNDDKITFV